MTWRRRYVLKSYFRSSLWIVPFIASLAEMATIRITKGVDDWLNWTPASPFSVTGAQTIFQTISTVTLSFLAFTFASMLVAIQVASAQLTPRIIATTLLRDNVIRFSAGIFIYTLLFAAGAQARMDNQVDHLVLLVAAAFGWISVLAFLLMVDYASRLLRPVTIIWRIGRDGLRVIESVYPNLSRGESAAESSLDEVDHPARVITHHGTSAIVLAVNVSALVAAAQRADVLIELAPQVGDFVAVGEPLFYLYETANAIDDELLESNVAFGRERTIEQDPTFAFRVIVDIACKALSKAINDPTTAVLAIDQLHRMLRQVGKRELNQERILDAGGKVRLIIRTPDWEDFVNLSCSEIRLYGAENPQIARRTRAMLENLIDTLPPQRHPALRQELALLDHAIERLYSSPEDIALARRADAQGLGGKARRGRRGSVISLRAR
jgi:uncharacterized membrane protein